MNPLQKQRLLRRSQIRIRRARELMAYADLTGITIGWDGEHTTFSPLDCDQRFIEEATLLSNEIKFLTEKAGRR